MMIESNISEQDLIEYCLSLWHSGYEYKLLFGLHSLANTWHIDKILYYYKLIEGSQ